MKLLDKMPTFDDEVFVAEIDGAKALTLRGFYPKIAKTLLFPDYFGKNLDALFDCLCSLDVVGKPSVVVVIHQASLFLSKEKAEKKEAALQVLRDAEKAENRYDGIQFKVIGIRGKK